MTAKRDVTEIIWTPPASNPRRGEVTIIHAESDNVVAPLSREEARRMADLYFGSTRTETVTGVEVHWFPETDPQQLARSA